MMNTHLVEVWRGNQQADRLAGDAADERAILFAQLKCYDWVTAVGALMSDKMRKEHLHSIIKAPSMTT